MMPPSLLQYTCKIFFYCTLLLPALCDLKDGQNGVCLLAFLRIRGRVRVPCSQAWSIFGRQDPSQMLRLSNPTKDGYGRGRRAAAGSATRERRGGEKC